MNQKLKKITTLFMVSVMLIAFTGCGITTSAKSTLNLATTTPSSTLNSVKTMSTADVDIIKNFGEGLTRLDIDTEPVAGMAESWDISEDKRTYTFHLRDATWQDGTPITANDFVFAWKKIATLPDAVYRTHILKIKNGANVLDQPDSVDTLGISAKDDKTFIVELEEPVSYFLNLVSTTIFYPINEAFYEKVGGDDVYGTSHETVLANGPFTITTYAGDSGFILEKNKKYWDANNVSLEKVDMKVVPIAETQDIMFEKGEIDMLELKGSLNDKHLDNTKAQAFSTNQLEFFYLSGTTGTPAPLLNNQNFRKAVAHSIDKKGITEGLLKDGSVAVDYLIPQDFVFLNGKDFRDTSGNFNDSYYNKEKATEYLNLAKQEVGDTPLEFTLLINDSDINKKIYEYVKGQIETNLPGLTVHVDTMPTAIFFPTLDELKTPAARTSWSETIADPISYFELFLSYSPANSAVYTNTKYDMLIEQAGTEAFTSQPEKRWDVLIEAENELLNDFVIIPLYQKGTKKLVSDKVVQYKYTNNYEIRNYYLIKLQ